MYIKGIDSCRFVMVVTVQLVSQSGKSSFPHCGKQERETGRATDGDGDRERRRDETRRMMLTHQPCRDYPSQSECVCSVHVYMCVCFLLLRRTCTAFITHDESMMESASRLVARL